VAPPEGVDVAQNDVINDMEHDELVGDVAGFINNWVGIQVVQSVHDMWHLNNQ
jgi:hypothetical protein